MTREGIILWLGTALSIGGIAAVDWRWAMVLTGIGIFASGCFLLADKERRT